MTAFTSVLLPVANLSLIENEEYTYMRSMHGFYPVCHSSGFTALSGSSVSAKHSKSGAWSSFLGLLPSISHRRLPNSLFVLFNLLLLLLSGENIAFRRRANEVRGDQSKVFICVLDSPCFREDSLRPPSISQPCMRSIVDKHCSGAFEHSLYCWILIEDQLAFLGLTSGDS